jgi:hypothetical protein
MLEVLWSALSFIAKGINLALQGWIAISRLLRFGRLMATGQAEAPPDLKVPPEVKTLPPAAQRALAEAEQRKRDHARGDAR